MRKQIQIRRIKWLWDETLRKVMKRRNLLLDREINPHAALLEAGSEWQQRGSSGGGKRRHLATLARAILSRIRLAKAYFWHFAISAMSAITLGGKLYMIEQERAFKREDAVRFLKHLIHHIPGKLFVVWDGSAIHGAGAVKDFLASGAASRLQLEQLPGGYAPDLNPDEGIWKHLKWVWS